LAGSFGGHMSVLPDDAVVHLERAVAGTTLEGVQRTWRRTYSRGLKAADSLVIGLAVLVAAGFGLGDTMSVPVLASALGLVLLWTVLIGFERAYDARFISTLHSEFTKLLNASVKVFALVASALFIFGWEIDRDFVAYVLLAGFLALTVERYVARRIMGRLREDRGCCFRVLAVGDVEHLAPLVSGLQGRERNAAFCVVGACMPGDDEAFSVSDVPVLGTTRDVAAIAERQGIDVVIVAPSAQVSPQDIRNLRWSLEGTSTALVMAPALADVSRSRVSVHPVSGLPLLFVEQPDFSIARDLVKGVIDRSVAAMAALFLLPFFALIALLIKLDSKGAFLFRQPRVGKDGELFRVWKFRTMVTDAEALKASLAAANETDGLLFKMKVDPRVTRVGAFLRRWSIDEVPQLINVLVGQMSLIGPRPLPVSPDEFKGHERRRFLVKPGITGLWQVSGRSDTTWDEAVRLDLYYVENWSLSLDLTILWRTVLTVLRGQGAY
jgi:exopolysaccharide biosynthesis polyprenyl glycosylphosphotransferase